MVDPPRDGNPRASSSIGFAPLPASLQARLIEARDDFEKIFDALVRGVPLLPEVNRKIYRLCRLTLLNNLSSWYRPGSMTPARIGDEVMKIFKAG